MDIRSAYAMKLGALLVDKLCRGYNTPDHLDAESEVEEECWNTSIRTDMDFAVIGQNETHDAPEPQYFEHVMDAVDAALVLAEDPREFQVYIGFRSLSNNPDEWVHVTHAAMV